MNQLVNQRFDVETQDIEYRHEGGKALQARLYLPRGEGPFPMIVEVHGGAWCRGSRLDEHTLNEALAQRGIAVAAVDFRMPPDGYYPVSLRDINFAVRWLKSTASEWRTKPDLIGLLGVSSGGHQAILAAMRPFDPRYVAESPSAEPDGPDARAGFVVACWPVIDPLGRYLYAKELQASGRPYPEAIDRVIPDHEKYWLDEATMAEGSPAIALERGELTEMPPVLYIQGEADIVHPRAHLDRFVSSYRRAGGELTLRLYPHEAEGFITKKPDSPATREAIADIAEFVLRQSDAISANQLR
jgi:acetyl esterase